MSDSHLLHRAHDLALEALLTLHDPRQPQRLALACQHLVDAWIALLLAQEDALALTARVDSRSEALRSLWRQQEESTRRDLERALTLAQTPAVLQTEAWVAHELPWLKRNLQAFCLLAGDALSLPQSLAQMQSVPTVARPRHALMDVERRAADRLLDDVDQASTAQPKEGEEAPQGSQPLHTALTRTGRQESIPRPPAPPKEGEQAPAAPPSQEVELPPPAFRRWLVHALQEAPMGMTPHELYEAAHQEGQEGLDPEGERALEQIREVLARSGAVLRTERDTWRHRDALGISPRLLEELVTWCLDILEGNNQPVHIRTLWNELDQAGRLRPGMSQWLLRDALARSCDAVTFRNEQLLAHVESYEDGGVTLYERLGELLRAAEGPLSLGELRQRLPAGVHYHTRAIYGLLMGAPWCLRFANDRFCHSDAVGLDAAQRAALVDRALALIPAGRPVHCEALVLELREQTPEQPFLRREDAPMVLWGVMLEDTRVQCGSACRVARSRSGGGVELVVEAVLETLDHLAVATAARLRQSVTRRYGYRGLHAFREAMERAEALGLVEKVGVSGYARVKQG